MQRLEITGDTPEEFYFNVINTLSLILRGSQAPPVEPAAEASVVEEPSVEKPEPEIIPPAPKKRGRPAKAAETVEHVKSDELNDDVPDLGGAPAKELTLDGDIKPRLQEISAACTQRGMTMPATVAYIQKLYGPFGIAKAPQLQPEQFAEFMEASEAYLDGSAEA